MVSVIVPTKNSASTLAECLRSVRAQSYKSNEVIVVDNFSTDGTLAIAQELADHVVVIGPERSAQTNVGARIATGEFVYRVDSDFVLSPGLIGEAVAASRVNQLDAVLIHNRSDPSAPGSCDAISSSPWEVWTRA
jgi:glycosyltransferase involved in cell wall biosynthesis